MAKPGGMPVGNQKGLGELWARLRFLFLAIIIYRIGTHIPVPGFDPDRLAELFNQNQGTFLGLFNMFSGGALERLSQLTTTRFRRKVASWRMVVRLRVSLSGLS